MRARTHARAASTADEQVIPMAAKPTHGARALARPAAAQQRGSEVRQSARHGTRLVFGQQNPNGSPVGLVHIEYYMHTYQAGELEVSHS